MKINVYKTSIFKMLILTFLSVAGLCYSSFADSFENESLSARALINAIKLKKNERAKEILKEVLETPYIDGILKTSLVHQDAIFYAKGVEEVEWLKMLNADLLIIAGTSDAERTTYLRSTSFLEHALYVAIKFHNNEIANELLKIPKVNPSYYTFRTAIFEKNNYMIEELLKTQHATYWINTTLLNDSFENFLFNNEISKKIIINNSNINVLNVALCYAITLSDYEMVQELLKNPIIKLNKQDKFGNTPLMEAIKKIESRRIEILIDEISKKVFNRSIYKNPSKHQFSLCYAIQTLDYTKSINLMYDNKDELTGDLRWSMRKFNFEMMTTIRLDAKQKAMTRIKMATIRLDAEKQPLSVNENFATDFCIHVDHPDVKVGKKAMTIIKIDDELTEDNYVNSCKIAKVLLNDPRINLKLYNSDANTIWDLASPDIRNLLGISNK